MKVNPNGPTYIQQLKPRSEIDQERPTLIATGIGIDIRHKDMPENVIKENNPDDPLVAKKVLDSLSLDLIQFSQRERDALASILGGKAKSVVESRA